MFQFGLFHLVAELQPVTHPIYLPDHLAIHRTLQYQVVKLRPRNCVIKNIGVLTTKLAEIDEQNGTPHVLHRHLTRALSRLHLINLDDVGFIRVSLLTYGEEFLIRTKD